MQSDILSFMTKLSVECFSFYYCIVTHSNTLLFISDDNCISPGIRYITETLIKKLSKQENLARVTTLNLSLAKDGGKKFKV